MFKLNSLALKTDTVFVQLRHPADDTLIFADEAKTKPVGINVYGTASEKYRTAVTAMQNRALKRGKKATTAEGVKEEGIELLVAISESADNLEYNGEAVATPASFRSLYSNPEFSWLRDQVDNFVGETANFLAQ